jgi:hypothetical protein
MPDNPFEVLRLSPASTEEEIVRHAARLRQRAGSEVEMNAIRQAVQALTTSALERDRHALLTHPRPGWHNPELEWLAGAFRRPPTPAEPPATPPFDEAEFTDLLLAALAATLDFQPLPLEPIDSPEDPAEVRRQTAEALWQSLLVDART